MARGRRPVSILCSLIAGLAAAGAARAEGVDGERFAPAVGTEPSFQFEHPTVPFHLGWGLGLFFDLADDPVVVRDDDGDGAIVARPLATAATADLVGALGLFGWAELGVHLPLQLVYRGDDATVGGEALSAAGGLGDLRFVPKVALLRRGDLRDHVLVGFALPVSLPTGDGDALRGADGVTVEPRLTAAWHLGRLGLGAGVGYRWRAEHPPGIPFGDELTLSAMAAIDLVPEALRFQAELFGGKQVGTDAPGDDLPLEGLAGLIWSIAPSLDLNAGVGFGALQGVGAPDVRGVVGVRFRHRAPTHQGFGDADGDGIMDKDDPCPDEAEDLDGFQDEDGCPEPDNDGDGVLDDADECPDLPEEAGGDGDGCPSKTYVEIVDGQMEIYGKIQFKTGSAELDRRSDPLLDQIAATMAANPQIGRVRIEGHTDSIAGDEINQRLSEERAATVKAALERRGVDGDRLSTAGRGESRPLAPNATQAGRARNRRVEFIIE